MKLAELTSFLDEYLSIGDCPDSALNGLQVEGDPEVRTVALAVDACSETFCKAAALKADILMTHHGIFWGRQFPLTGIHADRVRTLLSNGISLYAAHLPLDIHPVIGNNVSLIEALGFSIDEPFGEYKGLKIGYTGVAGRAVAYSSFLRRIRKKLGVKPVAYKFGRDHIRTIAVVSGGGAAQLEETAGTDIDIFVTGELSHPSYHLAKELLINTVFCGHYATETLGIQRLGDTVKAKFNLETVFIDVPTGM